MFKNLSNKLLLLIIGSAFLVCAVIVYLFFIGLLNDTILIVFCILTFVLISMCTNQITNRIVTKQFEKKYNNPKVYKLDEDLKKSLSDATITKVAFGNSYLFVKDDVAYKILHITNNELYFNNQDKERDKNKANKNLEHCTKFYGFEIFETADAQLIKKLELYTFQNDKIYYTAFYKEESNVIQANYETPNDIHLENYNYIINKLRMVVYES